MEYKGTVYGKIAGKYIPLTQTIEDLENEIKTLKTKKVDWQIIREKYFQECVMMDVSSDKSYSHLKINRAPHDLFEWFKMQVDSYCL